MNKMEREYKTEILKLDQGALVKKFCSLVETIAAESIARDDRFTIGLSGGSIIDFLAICLPLIKTDWSKWMLFFCDERLVPQNSYNSIYGECERRLLPLVPLQVKQFLVMEQRVSAKEAASRYQYLLEFMLLRSKGLDPSTEQLRPNLLLLGVGPDGHTCSLFPQRPLLEETKLRVAYIIDAPKPPLARITITLPVINNAENCIFIATTKQKDTVIERILKKGHDLPATRVKPTAGNLYWLLDLQAGSLL